MFAVALDSDGKRAASGAADGTVKLWDVADARLLVTLWSGAGDNWLALAPEGSSRGAECDAGEGGVEGERQAGGRREAARAAEGRRAGRPGRPWAEDREPVWK